MRSGKSILIAFLLNLAFSVFELIGGAITGSVAILSDSLHDLGDAASIGLSFFLERKSKRQPDAVYTYGYARFSVLGSLITTGVLFLGSLLVIYHAVLRILRPVPIHYNGMIVFAVVGVLTNLLAAYMTREGDSMNQKAVNLHMLEDVLGWTVVLVGAVVMRFTDISVLDPVMSIGVALYILFHACKNLKEILDLFLEKIPTGISAEELKAHLSEIEGVLDVHHIHVRSLDGRRHDAAMHIVADGDPAAIKAWVRAELKEHGIDHTTLELEHPGEPCRAKQCRMESCAHRGCHHHHHH